MNLPPVETWSMRLSAVEDYILDLQKLAYSSGAAAYHGAFLRELQLVCARWRCRHETAIASKISSGSSGAGPEVGQLALINNNTK